MTHSERIEKLSGFVEDIKICMMTTEQENKLISRPMSTVQMEENGSIWFFTNEHSGKISEIMKDENVNLSYVSQANSTYVSISGDASLVNNRAKVDELWNPIMNAWFVNGKDDPNLALIQVIPKTAEYWDASSSKLVQFYNIGKAIVTGQSHSDISNATNETINL